MTTAPVHTIEALCLRSRDISLEKGWLNADGTDPRPFYTVACLFHSELSEALEDLRNHRKLNEVYYEDGTKPCGFGIEVADFVIRVCQWAGSVGGLKANNATGVALEASVTSIRAATVAGRRVAEDGELLLAQLHTDVSLAFVTAAGMGLPGLPDKPLHYLATALLAVFDFCEKHGIDIWAAIDEKEAYNRTRSLKHGGKKV